MEETPTVNARQVNFTVENCGRLFKKSKIRVSWVFSIGDQQHTVLFFWSKKSGEQRVEVDEKEEWFGRRQDASVFSHKWITDEGVKLHILASRTIPQGEPSDFRKYELLINGQTFFSLPFQNGNMPEALGDHSIVHILYPDGYEWDDEPYVASKLPPSTAEEYKSNEHLRQMVTARRIVRHDGSPR
jgi:hypothetical protein